MAVAFSALVCGWAPAVLSALVGFFGVLYWFVDPRHPLSFVPQEIRGIIGFVLVCTVLIILGEANRRKQARLNQAVAALTLETQERKRTEEELQKAHGKLEQRVQERTSELSQTMSQLESEVAVRERAEEGMRRLSVRLMTLQDEERRRLARDLHDTTGQTLVGIKMTLASLRQATTAPEQLRLIDEVNALMDEASREIRTTSYLLHPPLLDEAGIASAGRWFVEGFAKRSGIHIDCSMPEEMQRPSRNCEMVLFRVLQESLTNVHRHSGASSASIELRREEERIILEVRDNGRGIPPERWQQIHHLGGSAGVGISGMRERVRELGGHLEVQSSETGTTVTVDIPVAQISERHRDSRPGEQLKKAV